MSKTKEKKRSNYNDVVIEELKERYGFTRRYIIMSITGERSGTLPTKIQEEYCQLDIASKKAIKSKINSL